MKKILSFLVCLLVFLSVTDGCANVDTGKINYYSPYSEIVSFDEAFYDHIDSPNVLCDWQHGSGSYPFDVMKITGDGA